VTLCFSAFNVFRPASPELFRASRTAQLIEEEFGDGGSPGKKNATSVHRAASIAGKHSEERILKRATMDARADSAEIKSRAVS
jgi:hypothetical protein